MAENVKSISEEDARLDIGTAFHLADEAGAVIILKDGKPMYKLSNLELEPDLELSDDEKIDVVSARVLKRIRPALEELAK